MITTTPPCGATCKRGSHTKMAPQGAIVLQFDRPNGLSKADNLRCH